MSLPEGTKSPDNTGPGRWRRGIPRVFLAVLAPIVFLACHRYITTPDGRENSVDCFYHVQIADMTPPVAYQRTFPWTTMSIWETNFHDKELLFHLILSPLRWLLHDVLKLSPGPPFHAEALFFTALVFLVFAGVGKGWGVPWLHVLALALAVVSPTFILRVTMLRPHNLGIALMLLAAWGASRVVSGRQWWIPVALGFLFVYGYSNPHFVLLPMVCFAAVLLVKNPGQNWRLALLLPGLAIAGLLLGLTLHPQVPNGFIIWRVQCVQVVRQILFATAPVFIGDEMVSPGAAWIKENSVVLCVWPVVIVALLGGLMRRLSWRQIPNETLAISMMALITVSGCFLSQRTLEYACPFTLLAIGLLVRDLRGAGVGKEWGRKRRIAMLATTHAVVIGAMYGVPFYTVPRQYPGTTEPLNEFAEWARQVPAGVTIANVDWGDFPTLFYSAPHIRYSVGLDPMFGYFRDPQRMAMLEKFRTGQVLLTPQQTQSLVGTRWIFMSSHLPELSHDLYRAHWFILWQGKDGWVFDLERSASQREAMGLKP